MKYAVKTLAPKLGLKVGLVVGDTPVEQGASIAQTVAQKMIANKSVLAVIGPSTSGAVAASSSAYFAAGMAHISPSATRTSLTKGSNREATAFFFRVVPGDYIQGPTDARFMADKLNAKKVVLIDFQEPYSQGLVAAAEIVLKAKGVSHQHPVDLQPRHRLLVVRDTCAGGRRHRVLPDAEAGRRPDVRAAARRAGSEGEGVRR